MNSASRRYLLGIDDTDDAFSRGTGFHGRQLARWLTWRNLVEVHSISRHQLTTHEAVECTSHNSAVCIEFSLVETSIIDIWQAARCGLNSLAAAESETGLCLAPNVEVPAGIVEFGVRCKLAPVRLTEARALSGGQIQLGPLKDQPDAAGQVGALAAVGLRAGGDDGRVIWLPKLRMMAGVFSLAEIQRTMGVEIKAATPSGQQAASQDRIKLGRWVRPLLRRGGPVLLIEQAGRGDGYEWKLLDKDTVKAADR